MRGLFVIVALAIAPGCARDGSPRFFERRTPHEAYAESLEKAGLGGTALARDWLNAAALALSAPKPATVPLTNEVTHDPARPAAYGYRLELRRGRRLRVELAIAGDEPARVFIDLFAVRPPEAPRHIASADVDATVLEREIAEDGTYILRIQPELLRGGRLRIGQRTTAALTFPVAGRSGTVQSYFRDPRDDNRREHHGIDIFAPRNTPVVAAADGYVTSVDTTPRGGLVVWVWDGQRRQSHYYAHLERQAVSVGARVRAGDVVGYVGNSGNARTTPPHLHFGIYGAGEGPIDPLPFVAPQ